MSPVPLSFFLSFLPPTHICQAPALHQGTVLEADVTEVTKTYFLLSGKSVE
jgi:hypothetical protein